MILGMWPRKTTPEKNAERSGMPQLQMESAIQKTVSEVSSGRIKPIESVAPSKRIKWDQHLGFTGILPMDRFRWRKTFQAVKINVELRIAHEWLLANPRKRKKNYYRFLTSWLSRCQDVGGSSGVRNKPAHCSGVWEYKPLTEEQIQAATAENERQGGACDKVDALRRLLRHEITEDEYNAIVHD